MATYVNDLRLTELATGEGSGTWGDTTNTNLELIANSTGLGSEAIANASTHTITMADGAADEFRSLFLRLTGGGQACTVTLAPNTLSHTWIMRNETAAALTLTQGSGANVVIAAGQTKIVATDGAGSGAVVYELDDIELAGNLAVGADATVGDDLTLNSDASVLGFGADTDTTLTHVADTGLLLNSTRQLQFGDSGTYIHQSADGVLDLVSDTEIEINATTIDINGNADISGTIAAGGVVTANAGVVVDELTIDADTITATDDFIIDAEGEIVLDANNTGQVHLKDNGTEYGRFFQDSNRLFIQSAVSDADILIRGNDGGSIITALTLDMSNAGAATFNSTVTASGTSVFASLDISGDIDVDGTTNLDVVDIDGAVDMASTLAVGSNVTVTGNVDASGTFLAGNNDSIFAENNLAFKSSGGAFIDHHTVDADITFRLSDSSALDTNALILDGSAGGAATFAGAITANAGVVVDNITIDGTEIDLSSGDLTLDVAGDIILDADGGDIQFKDGGASIAKFSNNGTNLQINVETADKDILFTGTDGSSAITALSLDMSDAGTATFNHDIVFTSGSKLIQPSGDLEIDVAGDIILDADGAQIRLKDAGTEFGVFSHESPNLIIKPQVQDGDLVIKGDDGGSTITALTLDMSAAGEATFNDDINLGDSKRLRMGAGGDFEIFHDGSNNYIKGATGDQDLIFQGVDGSSTITALTLDMSAAGEATFNAGINVNGTVTANNLTMLDDEFIRLGNSNDFVIVHSSGENIIQAAVSDQDIIFKGNDGGSTITALTLDMSAGGTANFGNGANILDDDVLALGNSTDFKLYHNSSSSINYIDSSAVANTALYFYGNDGGSGVNALIIDFASAGAATFNSDVTAGGNLLAEDIKAKGSGGLTLQTDDGVKRIIVEDSGNVVINETSVDADFRVESNGNANMLFVDGGNDRVGIGTTPNKLFHISEASDGTKIRLTRGGVCEWDFSIGNTSVLSGVGSGALEILALNSGTAQELAIGPSGGGTPFVHVTASSTTFGGAISKASGSFRIDHPLPAKTDTHHLVHSFVEAPQADNIYRGSVDLVDGVATVNIDTAVGMTDGTFVLLNTNVQCFTSNESGWTAIKGAVSGNTLTITAQDNSCTDTISWMVVGERHDQHMKNTDWTDSDGKVIVEPEKT